MITKRDTGVTCGETIPARRDAAEIDVNLLMAFFQKLVGSINTGPTKRTTPRIARRADPVRSAESPVWWYLP